MRLSENGRRLIQGFEGLSLKAYPDASGYSIGYGHFGAKRGDVITREEADRLFDADVAKYELAVSTVTPQATQPQFDAMVSLAYNVGTGDVKSRNGGFAGSTVARLHNMGDVQGAADAFRMWNKVGGVANAVLTKRREQERAVYLTGAYGYSGTSSSVPPMTPVASSAPSSSAAPAPQPITWSVPNSSPGAVAGGVSLLIAAAGALVYFLLRGGR